MSRGGRILPVGAASVVAAAVGAAAVVAAVAGAGLLVAACGGEGPVDDRPPRVVSLAPVATRFVVALGAGRTLVGVDAASAELIELAELGLAPEIVDFAGAGRLAPDIVIVPDLPEPGALAAPRAGPGDVAAGAAPEPGAAGAAVVRFAPHDLEELYEASRTLGAWLVGDERALAFESGIGRPLGIVGGRSPDRDRLRVVGVVSLDPVVFAGGHSFETDLIEIAGGTSVTHGGEDVHVPATPAAWAALAPEVALVFTREPPGEAARARARAALPVDVRVEFFAFDRDAFWLDAPADDARRLQSLLGALRHELRADDQDARPPRGD
ncbi:MAG: hypothetical protein R3E88_13340 [Myxococcota bacterium]